MLLQLQDCSTGTLSRKKIRMEASRPSTSGIYCKERITGATTAVSMQIMLSLLYTEEKAISLSFNNKSVKDYLLKFKYPVFKVLSSGDEGSKQCIGNNSEGDQRWEHRVRSEVHQT